MIKIQRCSMELNFKKGEAETQQKGDTRPKNQKTTGTQGPYYLRPILEPIS
jgi:hypothetical protein